MLDLIALVDPDFVARIIGAAIIAAILADYLAWCIETASHIQRQHRGPDVPPEQDRDR